jgi:hypothetical protein
MKVRDLFESKQRQAIIDKMEKVKTENGYLNCRLAVQLTIGVPKLESLPKITANKLQVGDVIAWGISHFALWLGDGDVVQVAGWGDGVTVQPIKEVNEDYDEPTVYYRAP